ncbi:MAG: tetratricopeptide repeat protein, partial [Candidatus Hodarchaeales archaeon]
IRAKCFYYMAFLDLTKGTEKTAGIDASEELLEKSLEIYQSIGDRQGTAWIIAWQGQISLQGGDLDNAKNKFTRSLELFESIRDLQGLNLVNSLRGLMFYQQGEKKQAEEILEKSFNSSIKIGNPVVLSYCFLPLTLLYIESGNRSKAEKCIHEFQVLRRSSNNSVAKLHESVAEAIFLKSSSRFIDKGKAQKKLLEILEETRIVHTDTERMFYNLPTLDKRFSSFIVFNLIELYLEEFKLTEDKKIMSEAQQLIDNHIQNVYDQKFSPELVELSLAKAKMSIVDGKIEKALAILEQVKQDANTNHFHHLEEKVDSEITQIEREFQKWDAAISVRDRIEKVQINEYLKNAQQMVGLYRSQ